MRFPSGVKIGTACIAAAVTLGAAGPPDTAESPANSAHADSAAVAATVGAFHKALANADSASALALLAPDAMILESGGTETRAEYRSHHLAGDIAFAKAVQETRGPLKLTVEGSTAWTVGTSTTQGEYNGRQINSSGVESMVLTKDSGGWRIRSIHWSSRTRRAPAS